MSLLIPVSLSRRELEVLKEFAKGKTYSEAGTALHISEHTVKWYQRWLHRKFGVNNRTALIIEAHKHRILNLDEY